MVYKHDFYMSVSFTKCQFPDKSFHPLMSHVTPIPNILIKPEFEVLISIGEQQGLRTASFEKKGHEYITQVI